MVLDHDIIVLHGEVLRDIPGPVVKEPRVLSVEENENLHSFPSKGDKDSVESAFWKPLNRPP